MKAEKASRRDKDAIFSALKELTNRMDIEIEVFVASINVKIS